MQEKTSKKISESYVQTAHFIMPGMTNNSNNLYGGELMKMIDGIAAMSFFKHSSRRGVTASMDNLNFIAPLPVGNIVHIHAYVSGVGTKSVEIFVKVFGEEVGQSDNYLAATAFLTFVSTDTYVDLPPIPDIESENHEQEKVLAGYPERRKQRLIQLEANLAFHEDLSL